MADYVSARREIAGLLQARVPLIGVRTIETQRGIRLLRELAEEPGRANQPFWIHSPATGLRDLRTNSMLAEDKSWASAEEYATAQFATRGHGVLIVVDPRDVADDCESSRRMLELSRLAEENSGCLVLISDSAFWSGLQRQGMTVPLDLPHQEEMHDLVVEVLSDHHGVVPIEWDEQDARRASESLVGVTAAEAINLMATTIATGAVTKADVDSIAMRKDRIFGDLAGIERVHLKPGDLEVGGLQGLRTWLGRRQKLMRTDLTGTDLRRPRGVLLVGVPGCGKSLSAKAIAAQWGMALYRLDLASVLGAYVGQSEGRLTDALSTADRVAPCVLWIDEIEKGLAGQSDSTGVGRRMVGQFLFWLQESQAPVFVVATSNDVRSLPPELLRKGRFDELFFVDLPDEQDRAEIIRLHHRRYLGVEPTEALLSRLVEVSKGFAGSDIEAALKEVAYEVQLETVDGRSGAVDPDYVVAEFVNTSPLSRTNPEQIEEIRAWGRERAVPAGRAPAATSDVPSPRRRVVLPPGAA